jgi:poly-gamma-glutamate synthesis protein (capsule biosynthesis protein)
MTGRGIDQVLPHPGNPVLYEPYMHDAREYVQLAEKVYGAIPRPVDYDYIWGDVLAEFDRARTDLRIVNLETRITSSKNHESMSKRGLRSLVHYVRLVLG